jgi:hypothetical protein
MSTDAPDKEKEYTHIIIVTMPGEEDPQKPVYHYSLKEASDDGDEIIKKHPDAECDIYQIRTRLRGKVEIIRQDYNSSKAD